MEKHLIDVAPNFSPSPTELFSTPIEKLVGYECRWGTALRCVVPLIFRSLQRWMWMLLDTPGYREHTLDKDVLCVPVPPALPELNSEQMVTALR